MVISGTLWGEDGDVPRRPRRSIEGWIGKGAWNLLLLRNWARHLSVDKGAAHHIVTSGNAKKKVIRGILAQSAVLADSGDRSTGVGPSWGPKRRPNTVLAWSRTEGTNP